MMLSENGCGLFVVASSFFSGGSILQDLPHYGFGIYAALELPAGTFAPFTNTASYLLVVRKRQSDQMFVAQLSQDIRTNRQIVLNLRQGKIGSAVELGRYVSPTEFRWIQRLRMAEQLREAERHFRVPPVLLSKLGKLGRRGADFVFQNADNAVYIPVVGRRWLMAGVRLS